MGGLALGAWIAGRAGARIAAARDPQVRRLRLYASLELLVASSRCCCRRRWRRGIRCSPGRTPTAPRRSASVRPRGASLLLLGVPAAAMGATFPFAAAWFAEKGSGSGFLTTRTSRQVRQQVRPLAQIDPEKGTGVILDCRKGGRESIPNDADVTPGSSTGSAVGARSTSKRGRESFSTPRDRTAAKRGRESFSTRRERTGERERGRFRPRRPTPGSRFPPRRPTPGCSMQRTAAAPRWAPSSPASG